MKESDEASAVMMPEDEANMIVITNLLALVEESKGPALSQSALKTLLSW